jgi:hypothetical protein
MKLRTLFYLATFLSIAIISCKKDDDDEPFDAAAQAIIDNEELIEYLKSHYYIPAEGSEPFGTIDTILNNETSLFESIDIEDVTYNDIDYKLYYLMLEQGIGEKSPTSYDSVFVKYRGFTLDSIKFDENINFNTSRGWLLLTDVVTGWKYGFPKFKEGVNTSQPGNPISFDGTGKGILFMPSGLAYANVGSGSIPANAPILFHIELAKVVRADNDNDGVLNSNEDLDGNKYVYDDDTDEDGTPNFVDIDDDNDDINTKDEDINGDGNPMNDDTDNDTIPNYLDDDDDGDGTLTKDESKTEDADGDGIVDYLDPDTK